MNAKAVQKKKDVDRQHCFSCSHTFLPSTLPHLTKGRVPAAWKAWLRHQNFFDNWPLSQYFGAVAFIAIITFLMYVIQCQICWCVQPGVFLSLRNKFWQLLHIRYWVRWNFVNWLCAHTWRWLLIVEEYYPEIGVVFTKYSRTSL